MCLLSLQNEAHKALLLPDVWLAARAFKGSRPSGVAEGIFLKERDTECNRERAAPLVCGARDLISVALPRIAPRAQAPPRVGRSVSADYSRPLGSNRIPLPKRRICGQPVQKLCFPWVQDIGVGP